MCARAAKRHGSPRPPHAVASQLAQQYFTLGRRNRILRVGLSKSMRSQPLLQQDPLYMIPGTILDALCDDKGRPLLDKQSFRVEKQLTVRCEARNIVGFHHGDPVTYALLDPPEKRVQRYWRQIQQLHRLKRKQPPSRYVLQELREKLAKVVTIQRGYAGWLVTNPTYHAELATLTTRWANVLATNELPQVGLAWMPFPRTTRRRQTQYDQFLEDFVDFCIRWRLEGLASTDLPVPLAPQIPIIDARMVTAHLKSGGFGMFLPDTFPVPGRAELREMGQAIQDRRVPDHLTDWVGIVRRAKSHPTGVDKFGHMLAVRHFWNVIRSRHSEVFRQQLKNIEIAVGKHLDLGRDAVGRLRTRIRRRLGS